MRSIIVEGIDGSGKDTLIRSLMAYKHWATPYKLHERASTSLGGPVPNLAEWVARDSVRMPETGPWIYNRHPLISEPIYAEYRKANRGLTLPWTDPLWLNAYRRLVGQESIVVLCTPPLRVVRKTLWMQGADAQMPGVLENLDTLYNLYANLMWPGPIIRYDYINTNAEIRAAGSLIRTIELINEGEPVRG